MAVAVQSVLSAGALASESVESLLAATLPLVEKYCGDCHSGDKPEAQLSVAAALAEAEIEKNPEQALAAVAAIRGYLMPPPDAPQPGQAERERLLSLLTELLDRCDERRPPYPGSVPLRRLNRAEYHNTLRDLLGIELPLTNDFPADDTAHGFDNVADGLSLSPLLMEKYLAAAEQALDKVVVEDGKISIIERRLSEAELSRNQKSRERNEDVSVIGLDGEVSTRIDVPLSEDYLVRVLMRRIDEFAEPATLVLKVDGVDAHVWNVPRGNAEATLEARVPLRAGQRRISVLHTWHTAQVPKGVEVPKLEVSLAALEVQGPLAHLAHRKIFCTTSGEGVSEAEAAEQVLTRFASLAFRRPVEEQELKRLLQLFQRSREAGRSPIQSTRAALAAVLVSPHFLFHVERDASSQDRWGAIRLNDWELASRLSYFLWSSTPDESLRDLAAERKLTDEAVLRAQVRRMLADPKAQALVDNFAGQWLGLRRLDTLSLDKDAYPQFRESLRQSMREEPLRFFATILHEDRKIDEFISADWTWLNEELASLYGLREVKGNHFRQVTLTDANRGGVLTMPATMAITSLPTRTSAVKRGKWVLDELLGTPPPPPPPNVPELPPAGADKAAATTLRERLEQHRADPRCYACHVQMDTLGLGLENFDPLGRWRKHDGGQEIDPAGMLPDGQKFSGPAELKQTLLARRADFTRCLTEKMFVYALGRGMTWADRREVKRIAELVDKDGRLSTLLIEVACSYPFRYRKDSAEEALPSVQR